MIKITIAISGKSLVTKYFSSKSVGLDAVPKIMNYHYTNVQ